LPFRQDELVPDDVLLPMVELSGSNTAAYLRGIRDAINATLAYNPVSNDDIPPSISGRTLEELGITEIERAFLKR